MASSGMSFNFRNIGESPVIRATR